MRPQNGIVAAANHHSSDVGSEIKTTMYPNGRFIHYYNYKDVTSNSRKGLKVIYHYII